ncbi:MAG: PAS domain-containing protein [Ignavibacterium sp.]|nr:PAS domain-containing protein [Ignavibacterium sp.]
MKISFKVRPKILIFIALVVSVVMISSAYFELRQNKEEVFHLLTETAQSLSETITTSSINALNSSNELEDLIAERLLNNARMIRVLDSLNLLTHEKLIQIGKLNDLFRINIFDKNGNRVLTNRVIESDDHLHGEENVNRYDEVKQILKGEMDEMIIGLKQAMYVDEQRFAVAVARSGMRGAIVVNMNAGDFLQFRKKIGIGKIIGDMGNDSEIEFIALQDSIGILAASSSVKELSSFSDDSFLNKAKLSDSTFSRVTIFDNREVFEAVRGLYYDGEFIGVSRIGISLDEVRSIESRIVRRIIIISIILAAISIILLSVLFSNQNLNLITQEYSNFKSFTNSFLQNMNEAVLTVSKDMKVTLFNLSAENLFSVPASAIIGKTINETGIKTLDVIAENIKSEIIYKNLELSIEKDNTIKFISVNIIPNYNLDKVLDSYTIIINDITELKNIEEQIKRNEKMLAMGELASGVAHEIRNPINSIGMIGQRLKREFIPQKDSDEYGTLTSLLTDEVSRINKIINQFLQYAKPLDLQTVKIDVSKLILDIYHLFIEQAHQRNISFNVNGEKNLNVKLDPELFKQAIFNFIQNAFEAVENGGKVLVEYLIRDDNFLITINDNGKGIDEKDQSKIFDLYYTTRKEGTGIGLSISQKIISQHNGVIDFTSGKNGTTFNIKIPLQ